ncbi:secreted antigen 3 [Babesia divergens]|uniref:Secreted antigen 3 n=1 Tax=Babesia divergens TaxID=32595 RepID=A0AAD9GJA3_BABDI|nr:secreted antigen 3 [Babesia divergens]
MTRLARGLTSSLATVFTKAKEIRSTILETTRTSGTYHNFDRDHKDQDCHVKISKALKACLPKTFAALFFLFFNVSKDCTSIGGGSWNTLKVKGSGTSLYNWLTDGSDDFIARKFSQEDLHPSKTGQNVATALQKAVSLTPNINDGSLQKVLCGFMFVCKWHDALTGHAICFLYKFCSNVLEGSEDFLKEPYKEHSGAFKDVCRGLKDSLTPFINGSSGLSAVCHGNTDLFKDLWDDGKFLQYCEWLKENLDKIIQSLASMSQESSAWSLSTIQSGGNAGPFKYGFVFKASWDGSTSMSKLQGYISKLTGEDSGSLQKFISFLENPSTPSSPAATAGGVFTGLLGTGGLGAGAAYATNAFGFQNLVTSLISSFLK